MTDKSEGSNTAPGSGAGDAAPTQAIPRIPKPAEKKTSSPAKSTPAKSKPAAKKATPASTQTDKGRPREAASEAKIKPETGPQKTGPAKSTPAKTGQVKTASGPTGRPLTAADYARTTKPSPATTAVIPAVKDAKSGPSSKQAPVVSPAPVAGRRASLRLTRLEPWSVARLAFAISVAMMIVAVVAVTIFWVVLDFVGVWDQINDSFTTVLSDESGSFNVTDYFGFGRVVGLTLVLSAVNVILMTVLATIAAHLYNLAAQLMGGIDVTFSEER